VRLAWALVGLAGCGRFDFARVDPDAGVVERSCWPRWQAGTLELSAPQRVAELASNDATSNPSLSLDGMTLYFERDDGNDDLFVTQRTSRDAPWGTPARIELLTTNRIESRLTPSADGMFAVFTSNRDGNPELYVMNRDGSNVRRITNNPAIDTTPTWSPNGTQISFVSDRGGTPQIYIMGADGLNLRRITQNESWADRPTWAPAPFNEIAFTARTGPGFDIKVYDLASSTTRQITFGEGSNESPAFSPNGRHLAFASSRNGGRYEIYTMARDGKNVKQITRDGSNYTPSWSN